MDPKITIDLQGNEAPHQHVYIIQLDPRVQIESPAIPLHTILENDLDGDLILPLLQQKQGQRLQLLIEPLRESTEVSNKTYQKSEAQNEITPYAQLNSIIPVTSINNQLDAYRNCNVTIAENLEVKDKITKIRSPIQKLKNYVHISDVKAPPRAIAVLPTVLQIRGKWISPRRTLSPRIRFGPVQGIRKIITQLEANKLLANVTAPVFLLYQDADHVVHIDVSDKDKSNWIGLLPLGDPPTPTSPSTANVWLYEESNELYALTMQPIAARRPLRLGYSKKYVESHNIPQGPPVLDLETVNPVQWWCNECNRGLPSATLLQRHVDVYHKDGTKPWRSPYRCRYCKRAFVRLFTMRRHMRSTCLKRPQKSLEEIQQSTELRPEPDISSTFEDNRIPSDESFQNFTNSLDFSTNLFDTDRISGLDISGNSRADSDLNPYSIGFRDDNGLSNDLGFTKLTNTPDNSHNNETNQEKKEPEVHTCSYCDQVIVKENKSKHFRQCPSRLICECGRVFRHKQSLALHVHKCHPSEKPVKTDTKKPEEDKNMAYKCQECPFGFKRRGMLVNHLWRIHKMISTMPVEKKVRHYPCVACPKIYRSATKRNKHVRVHHPGAEKLRGQSIEGGVKSCQPASCTECPRQYATRAKLLQHVRAHHPHLANVMKKQATEKKKKLKTDSAKKEAADKDTSAGNQLRFNFY